MLINISTNKNKNQRTVDTLMDGEHFNFTMNLDAEKDDEITSKIIASNMVHNSMDVIQNVNKKVYEELKSNGSKINIVTDYTSSPEEKFVEAALYYFLNDQEPNNKIEISVFHRTEDGLVDLEVVDIGMETTSSGDETLH